MMPARMVIGQKNKPENEASSRASWNTPRSDSRTRMSYGSRMALSFALTSLMTVGILVCVISVVWGGVFSEYTRANVTELARLTSEKLASIYETSGEWTLSDLASLSDSTMVSDDIGLQVIAADGTVLYDDTWPAAPVAAELKRLREQEEAAQQRAYVLFNDDKGLRLSVKRDSLLMIESADNYVCVWYLNNGAVKKTMVRNTMKRVAEQLGDDNIRRCHRSYMVNMDRVKVLRREKEGVFIEFGLDGVPDIPISKTYAKSITSWLMK